MSQIPPQGYPGGGGYQQGGYPPPGQPMPGPYGQPGFGPAPSMSAAALTSLICGLLGCVPFVTGLIALITGIVGINATKNPMKTGRGMAIAGLILGLISIVGWGGYFGVVGFLVFHNSPQKAAADQFFTALGQGNVTQAASLCTNNVSNDQLQSMADKIKGWGGLQSSHALIGVPSVNGQPGTVTGFFMTNNSQTHKFNVSTVDQNNTPKIDSFMVQ